MATITDGLLAFATTAVPADAAGMMRLSLFDWAACGVAGAQETEFAGFRSTQTAMNPGPHVILGGGTANAPTAALINGTLSHALDYDDTHFAHIGHPSVAVVPAVLALAQTVGADLATLTDAATIGVEASIAVGLWLGRDHYQVGYHQTATAGAFGATLAACRLLDLDPVQSRYALGLCASMASGIKAQFGTMAKPLNAGLAARTGVEAALWAQAGMTAAEDGLAGPLGFGATHHGQGATVDLPRGSADWHILTISHKFHACCHGLHAMLEALATAKLSADEVAQMHIRTHPRWMSVCNILTPQTGLAAKFSYGQTAAMTLTGRSTSRIDSFTDAVTQDPVIRDLRARITVSEDARLTETQSEIAVTLADGSVRHLRHDLMTPMTLDQRANKLRSKAQALLGDAPSQALWQAAQERDLQAFTDQLVIS
ncbi:MmgE/PrpD family protein [Sulfitobacter noctilucae]|uniref:MmgE/PrpD family protein n=1 Tax=Sulfitobacter noctilucae TaxID=1342302 RepID=UPI00046836E4|nr:MmgE/PrpD family protein [Sulfitobacter noctilucae]KIN60963.1 MmgE/PrpD family protein [Sulfitobacter noctilucae]